MVLTLLELRNFQMSVKNKATGTPLGMYHIYNPYWLIAFSNELIGGTIYLHRRGASSVVRFDRQGNAKALIAWDGQQTGSALFLCLFVFEDFSKKLGKYHVNID